MAGQVKRLLPALAVVGAGFIAFQLWGYVSWLLDGTSTRFETGAEVPSSVRNSVLLGQVLMPAVTVVWLTFVLRGVFRARALTWPAALTLVWGLTYWQESLANVTGARFAYNTEFFDRGDWTNQMPFIDGGGPGLPQPLAMEAFVFVGLFPAISFGIAAMLRVLRRRTGWQTWGVVLAGYAFVLVVEFLIEMRSISQGVHSYPEVFGALSIHDGAANQFPLYENWLLSLMWFLPGLALFLLRDGLRPSTRGVLVGVGALNLAFLLYNLIAFVWLPADTVAPMPPWLNP